MKNGCSRGGQEGSEGFRPYKYYCGQQIWQKDEKWRCCGIFTFSLSLGDILGNCTSARVNADSAVLRSPVVAAETPRLYAANMRSGNPFDVPSIEPNTALARPGREACRYITPYDRAMIS